LADIYLTVHQIDRYLSEALLRSDLDQICPTLRSSESNASSFTIS
jgi:hypothetical protein